MFLFRRLKPQLLPKWTCVCGHHENQHGSESHCYACGQLVEDEGDDRCQAKDCKCEEYVAACQNCGEAKTFSEGGYAVCSRRCLLQIEYAKELIAA